MWQWQDVKPLNASISPVPSRSESTPIFCNLKERSLEEKREMARTMRQLLCKILARLGFNRKTLPDMGLVIGEALANAFCHNSPDLLGNEFVLIQIQVESEVVIRISNSTNLEESIKPRKVDDVYCQCGRGMLLIQYYLEEVFSGKVIWEVFPRSQVVLTCNFAIQ